MKPRRNKSTAAAASSLGGFVHVLLRTVQSKPGRRTHEWKIHLKSKPGVSRVADLRKIRVFLSGIRRQLGADQFWRRPGSHASMSPGPAGFPSKPARPPSEKPARSRLGAAAGVRLRRSSGEVGRSRLTPMLAQSLFAQVMRVLRGVGAPPDTVQMRRLEKIKEEILSFFFVLYRS